MQNSNVDSSSKHAICSYILLIVDPLPVLLWLCPSLSFSPLSPVKSLDLLRHLTWRPTWTPDQPPPGKCQVVQSAPALSNSRQGPRRQKNVPSAGALSSAYQPMLKKHFEKQEAIGPLGLLFAERRCSCLHHCCSATSLYFILSINRRGLSNLILTYEYSEYYSQNTCNAILKEKHVIPIDRLMDGWLIPYYCNWSFTGFTLL